MATGLLDRTVCKQVDTRSAEGCGARGAVIVRFLRRDRIDVSSQLADFLFYRFSALFLAKQS